MKLDLVTNKILSKTVLEVEVGEIAVWVHTALQNCHVTEEAPAVSLWVYWWGVLSWGQPLYCRTQHSSTEAL